MRCCIAMAYIVMVYIVMADIVMVHIVMARCAVEAFSAVQSKLPLATMTEVCKDMWIHMCMDTCAGMCVGM